MPEPIKPKASAAQTANPVLQPNDPVAAAVAALNALSPEQRAALNIAPNQPGGHVPSPSDALVEEQPAPPPQVVHKLGEREYQKFRPDAVVEVPFKLTHMQYVERRAQIEGRSPNDMVQKMVREAMAADPTKAGLVSGGASGKRGQFNALTGRWD